MKSKEFYKEDPKSAVWWVDNSDTKGVMEFSFDKKHIFNLFQDYPHKLTKEQREIFDKEYPEWQEFFSYRTA